MTTYAIGRQLAEGRIEMHVTKGEHTDAVRFRFYDDNRDEILDALADGSLEQAVLRGLELVYQDEAQR